MTKELLAEQYAEKECCKTCHNINHFCKEKCECWDFAKKGFIAGHVANEPRWHDLRKDPKDLPYMETELLCQKSSGRCFVGFYKHTDDKFHSYETGKSYDIVRWMDIGIWWNVPKV